MAATTTPKSRNSRRRKQTGPRTATHRPALQPRRFRHDKLIAVDLFSGFGGLTAAAVRAGFDVILAANHDRYKIRVHEANNPEADHWIADLVDPESSDYHSAADLPAADLLLAGVSCTSHSQANTTRAYSLGLTLFDVHDEQYEARVTRSERDRATALCVLQYAAKNHPRMMLIECTTEIQAWGPAIPGKPKIGDGSTYRWWLRETDKLEYNHKILFLNSQFFGVGQSRNRWFGVFWKKELPAPDLEHRPMAHCRNCDETLPAVWTWKTGIPLSGSVNYGKQYIYACPRCRREVVPPMTPSIDAIDLSDLGTRIGDRAKPLAPATMARAERCRQRFAEFPAILMPAKANRGVERHLGQPMSTQTSQQEAALLSTGKPVMAAVDNFQGIPRGVDEPLPTQPGSETLALVSAGVLPFRRNTVPTVAAEPMPTVTSDQIPGLITAAGIIKNNGSIDEAVYRAHPVSNPLGTIVAEGGQSLLFSGWQQNSGAAAVIAEWRTRLLEMKLEDCHFRMLAPSEVGRGCGFDVDFAGRKGTYIVWGSNRDQVDGFGNAVTPAVGEWIGLRLRAVLDGMSLSPWAMV